MSGLGEPKTVDLEGRRTSVRYYDTRDSSDYEHLLVLFHGCGYTSQTFGAMVASFPRTVKVVAFDCRGHGGTRSHSIEDDRDLSLKTLVDDAKAFMDAVIGPDCKFSLCGHSMGGAIAARVAKEFPEQCRGIVMIDAVEGLVLQHIVAGERSAAQIPTRFRTPDDAVRYALTTSHNGHFSAAISTPDRLTQHPEGGFTWRTDVLSTSKFWSEWFKGLSADFLSLPCLKLLVLAGVENLDTPLSAGHMQGKFQLQVLASVKAGHFVQEDAPGQTASLIVMFLSRLEAKEMAKKTGGLSAREVIALNAKLRTSQANAASLMPPVAGTMKPPT